MGQRNRKAMKNDPTDKNKKNNPNHIRTVYLANIIVLCSIILVCLGGLGYLIFRLHESRKELSLIHDEMTATSEHSQSLYTADELEERVSAATSEAEDRGEAEGKREALQQIQSSLENGESVEMMLRDMFPDNYVVESNSRYYFYPILKNVKTNLYPASDFKLGDDGRMAYVGSDGDVKCDFGIDVSSETGTINWRSAAEDGVQFAVIRIGYSDENGTPVVDEKFEENVNGAYENGIEVGVYFRLSAITDDEAAEDAQFVLDTIGPLKDKISAPVALVLAQPKSGSRAYGQSKNAWTSHAANFIAVLNGSGTDVCVAGNGAAFAMMIDLTGFEDNEKWIFEKSGELYFPYRFTYWQYNTGEINGIEGKVNYDLHIYKE